MRFLNVPLALFLAFSGAYGATTPVGGGILIGGDLVINGMTLSLSENPDVASLSVTNSSAGAITLSDTNNTKHVRFVAPNLMATNVNFILPDRPTTGLLHTTLSAETNATLSISGVAEADFLFTDVTTGNSSTTQHGLLPKLNNNAATYLDGTGAFSTPAGGGGSASTALKEEFMAGLLSATVPYGPLGLFKIISGTSANTTAGNATTTEMGICQLSTGTTTTGYTQVNSDSVTLCFGTKGFTNTFKFRLQVLPDAVETYTARIGFGDSGTAQAPTDGAMFRISTNDTHFVCATRANNVETLGTNTTVVTAGQWYVGKIVIADNGSTATFTIDGADAVVLGGLPTGTSRLTGMQASIVKEGGSTGTTARTLHIDRWEIDYYRGTF